MLSFPSLSDVRCNPNTSQQVSSSSKTTTGASYNNEYVLFLELESKEGSALQIKRFKEFVDSKYSTEFFPAEKARQEAAGRKFP